MPVRFGGAMTLNAFTKAKFLVMLLVAALMVSSVTLFVTSSSDAVDYDSMTDINDLGDSTYVSQTNFKITDVKGWEKFTSLVNGGKNFYGKNVYLLADLDFSSKVFTSVGYIDTTSRAFSGSFHGEGHKIANISLSNSEKISSAVFGYLMGTGSRQAIIEGLTVENITVSGTGKISGLVAQSAYAEISNCSVTGDRSVLSLDTAEGKFIDQNQYLSGIVAYAIDTNVDGCTNYATLSLNISSCGDSTYVGGIVGYVNSSTVRNCTNNGDINVLVDNNECTNNIGGIIGVAADATLFNLTNNGKISSYCFHVSNGTNAYPFWIGGIAAEVFKTEFSAEYSVMAGNLRNNGDIDAKFKFVDGSDIGVAGIFGKNGGSEGASATTPLDPNGNVIASTGVSFLYGRGITSEGLIQDSNISVGISNSTRQQNSNVGIWVGGAVGFLLGKVTNIETYGDLDFTAHSISVPANIGGVCSNLYGIGSDGVYRATNNMNITAVVKYAVPTLLDSKGNLIVSGYCFRVAGVVGHTTVIEQKNTLYPGIAQEMTNVANRAEADNNLVFCKIVDCVNNGTLDVESLNVETYNVGGIVASNTCTVDSCYNYGDITNHYDGNYGGACQVGGIVAAHKTGDIYDCSNYGDIELEIGESGGCLSLNYGGAVGSLNCKSSTFVRNLCNYGDIHLNAKDVVLGVPNYKKSTNNCWYGGVIGFLNTQNSATLILRNCSNAGDVSAEVLGMYKGKMLGVGGFAGEVCSVAYLIGCTSDCTIDVTLGNKDNFSNPEAYPQYTGITLGGTPIIGSFTSRSITNAGNIISCSAVGTIEANENISDDCLGYFTVKLLDTNKSYIQNKYYLANSYFKVRLIHGNDDSVVAGIYGSKLSTDPNAYVPTSLSDAEILDKLNNDMSSLVSERLTTCVSSLQKAIDLLSDSSKTKGDVNTELNKAITASNDLGVLINYSVFSFNNTSVVESYHASLVKQVAIIKDLMDTKNTKEFYDATTAEKISAAASAAMVAAGGIKNEIPATNTDYWVSDTPESGHYWLPYERHFNTACTSNIIVSAGAGSSTTVSDDWMSMSDDNYVFIGKKFTSASLREFTNSSKKLCGIVQEFYPEGSVYVLVWGDYAITYDSATYDIIGEGAIDSYGVHEGLTVHLPSASKNAPVGYHYIFEGWDVGGVVTTTLESNLGDLINIKAIFTYVEDCNITLSTDGEGSVTETLVVVGNNVLFNGNTATSGENAAVAEPAKGYIFDHWTVNGESVFGTTEIKAGDQVMAVFSKVLTATLAVDPNSYGSISKSEIVNIFSGSNLFIDNVKGVATLQVNGISATVSVLPSDDRYSYEVSGWNINGTTYTLEELAGGITVTSDLSIAALIARIGTKNPEIEGDEELKVEITEEKDILYAETIETLKNKASSDSKTTLEMKVGTSTILLDNTALKNLADGEAKVGITEDKPSAEKGYSDDAAMYSISIGDNHDFNGGKLTISLKYVSAVVDDLIVYHILSDDNIVEVDCTYKDGHVVFETDSLSSFVVDHKKAEAEDKLPIYAAVVVIILVAAVLGAVILFRDNRYKGENEEEEAPKGDIHWSK